MEDESVADARRGGDVDEAGALVADGAEAFAASIIELLQNNTLAEQLGNEAKQLATDQYHNNKVIARLLNFYNTQQHT